MKHLETASMVNICLKEGSYKKLSNDEIKNYIPSKKIKKARGDDIIIETTKGQYRQSIPDAEDD